jgi:hypothetical protein
MISLIQEGKTMHKRGADLRRSKDNSYFVLGVKGQCLGVDVQVGRIVAEHTEVVF